MNKSFFCPYYKVEGIMNRKILRTLEGIAKKEKPDPEGSG